MLGYNSVVQLFINYKALDLTLSIICIYVYVYVYFYIINLQFNLLPSRNVIKFNKNFQKYDELIKNDFTIGTIRDTNTSF
jgi:hypothetical protein